MYPVAPALFPENGDSQSYIDRPVDTLESDEDSSQSMGNTVAKIGGQLQYVSTVFESRKTKNQEIQESHYSQYGMGMAPEADPSEVTTAYGNLNTKQSHNDEQNEDASLKTTAPHRKGYRLHPHGLATSFAQAGSSPTHVKGGASDDLQIQMKPLEAEIQTLRCQFGAARILYLSMKRRKDIQEAKLNESLRNLALSQNEARGLRDQVQALQNEMLAQVSRVEVISDEALSRDFHALASLIKSLSRSVQLPQDVEIFDVLDPIVILGGVAKHHWDTRARKKAYIEAWIWSVLILKVFTHPFGFCANFTHLHDIWCLIFRRGFVSNWPEPTPKSENWRCTTVKEPVGRIGYTTIIAGQNHGESSISDRDAHHLQEGVLTKRKFVADIIRSYLTTDSSNPDLSWIPEIVDRAFALALNMYMQPFRVQITWPSVGEGFEADWMSPIPDRNGQDIHGGVVAFVVNPGLTRWGDVHGQNFEICQHIVPSLVQLEPVQTRRGDAHARFKAKQEGECA